MKKFFLYMAFLLIVISAKSQIPNTISWQGVLQDANGNLLDGNYDITVKLYDVATGGTELWSETHQDVQIENGFTNLILGTIENLNIPFDTQYWLEITIDNGNPMSRMILTSSPYSLYSKSTSNIIEGQPLILKDSEGNDRMIFNPNEGSIEMLANDTVWYSIEVNSPPQNRIVNADGSFTIICGNDEFHFDKEGKAIWQKEKTSYDDKDYAKIGTIETTKHYGLNGNVVKEIIYKIEYDSNNVFEIITEINYNSSGVKISESKTEKQRSELLEINDETQTKTTYNNSGQETNKVIRKFQHGNLVSEEFFQNGVKANQKDYSLEKTDNSLFNPDGTLDKIVTLYQNQLISKLSKGGQHSTLTQTENSLQFQNSGNPSTLKISQSTGEGYKIELTNSWASNPSISLKVDQFGGINLFEGYNFFKNCINTEEDIFAQSGNFEGNLNVSNSVYANNGYYDGNLFVDGSTNANTGNFVNLNVSGTKNFRIDHPLDPQNKYLIHAAIESNEVLNQYSGNVITDANGIAKVQLPDYFDKININYRYQLTVIGEFAQAIISKKISNNQFEIRTDKPNIEVSWVVIAERYDDYLKQNPFEDESAK